jgi:hypothetical protein
MIGLCITVTTIIITTDIRFDTRSDLAQVGFIGDFLEQGTAMRNLFWKPALLAMGALALATIGTSSLSAQDRQEEHHDQAAEHRDDHRDDHAPAGRDEHHDEGRPDPASQYRHDHPHASARCHDGFFTTTKDRGHACGKHGGIDVWLVLLER